MQTQQSQKASSLFGADIPSNVLDQQYAKVLLAAYGLKRSTTVVSKVGKIYRWDDKSTYVSIVVVNNMIVAACVCCYISCMNTCTFYANNDTYDWSEFFGDNFISSSGNPLIKQEYDRQCDAVANA